MKKNKVLLLGLLVLPLLASCTQTIIKPKRPYPGDPIEQKASYEEEKNMTVNFYLDYSHSASNIPEGYEIHNPEDCKPIYTMKWYMLKPLEKCPQEALDAIEKAKADGKVDPLYPDFLGWSEYSSSMDESKLWNFATDYKQSNILNLYGIWVNKGGNN